MVRVNGNKKLRGPTTELSGSTFMLTVTFFGILCVPLLFSLLSIPDPAMVRHVWALLDALPTPRKIKEDVVDLRGFAAALERVPRAPDTLCRSPSAIAAVAGSTPPPPWTEVFDGSVPLRLLYSLKVVAQLLEGSEAAAAIAACARCFME